MTARETETETDTEIEKEMEQRKKIKNGWKRRKTTNETIQLVLA